jgi:hypothetical protein
MSTNRKPLNNPTPAALSQLVCEIQWLKRKMLEVEEQMKRRPSKIKHLNDLQRQLDHTDAILEFHNGRAHKLDRILYPQGQ